MRHDIRIDSFDDLLAAESEIVTRINRTPNGGRLLLVDPLRLLREIGVHLSEDAIRAWDERASGSVGQQTGYESVYDALAASDPELGEAAVEVFALFTGEGAL